MKKCEINYLVESEDWFSIWVSDRKAMITTMYRNMTADLECGYDINGESIRRQKELIRRTENDYAEKLELLKTMDLSKVNQWAFFELVKVGAIEI